MNNDGEYTVIAGIVHDRNGRAASWAGADIEGPGGKTNSDSGKVYPLSPDHHLATLRPGQDWGLSNAPCEVRMSLERYQRYQAVATLVHSTGLIPEATLPALVDFLLVRFGKAVAEYVRDAVEGFYAFAKELLEEEDE